MVTAELGWAPRRSDASPIAYETLAPFLHDLFANLQAFPDDRLHVANILLGGIPSNCALLTKIFWLPIS